MTTLAFDALEPVVTSDGSTTWRWRDRDLTYRTIHGARTESDVVFLRYGGLRERSGPWRVAEVGFGVGTNFRTVAAAASELGFAVDYFAVECRPPPPEVIVGDVPGSAAARAALGAARDGEETVTRVEGAVELTLRVGDWLDHPPAVADRHAVFFDPFSPHAEPESWSQAAIDAAVACLVPDGRFTTYSAAVRVRRALLAAGMHVLAVPGPGHKREVLVAARTLNALAGLRPLRSFHP